MSTTVYINPEPPTFAVKILDGSSGPFASVDIAAGVHVHPRTADECYQLAALFLAAGQQWSQALDEQAAAAVNAEQAEVDAMNARIVADLQERVVHQETAGGAGDSNWWFDCSCGSTFSAPTAELLAEVRSSHGVTEPAVA